MKKTVAILMIVAAAALVGCDNDDDVVIIHDTVYDEDVAPPVPQGVYSITGDGEVLLYWLPIDDVNGDFDRYIVYRSDVEPYDEYWPIGETTNEFFIDDSVANGYTYYYAVSSVDFDGNLSPLSYEDVFDTPRPEGYNSAIFDFNTLPDYAGWSFSEELAVPWTDDSADIYLEYYAPDDVFYLNVTDIYTDIQDMGFTDNFDEITFAPTKGWSKNGWLEVIWGHTYVVWTADNHFAKVRITSVGSNNIIFDWGYQVATGNRELKPLVRDAQTYLRHPERGQ